MRALEALEGHPPRGTEMKLRRTLDQILRERRHQDLPAGSQIRDPGSVADVAAEEVSALLEHLAGVNTDTNPDRFGAGGLGVMACECPLGLDGGSKRLAGAGEGKHESIPT